VALPPLKEALVRVGAVVTVPKVASGTINSKYHGLDDTALLPFFSMMKLVVPTAIVSLPMPVPVKQLVDVFGQKPTGSTVWPKAATDRTLSIAAKIVVRFLMV
jgi:hypothetical protein